MARTAITGAVNVVKYGLMTDSEFKKTRLNAKVHERMKQSLKQAKKGDLIYKAANLCASLSIDETLRARSKRWVRGR
jgi:hypothetical protein